MNSGGSCPSLYVDNQIAKKAEILINRNIGSSVREGLELLLTNDLSIGQDLGSFTPPSGSKNVGELLQNGLRILANAPHSTLDIDLSAQTVDVRKAYKKMALKYHPDKNPHTTPIFQAIQGAHEKLTDKVKRKEEEEKAKRAAASSKPPSNTPAPSTNNGSYSYQPKPSAQQYQQQPHPAQSAQYQSQSKPSQSSNSQSSQSNPRPAPPPPPSQANSKKYPSDDQYYEEKYRQGGYGYQGEYRFQEAQRKAREREELKRAGAAARGHHVPEASKSPSRNFQDGRNREYQQAAARAAERRKQSGVKGESNRNPTSTPSFSAQKTMKKTKKFKSTLSSSSSEPVPLTSLPAPTGLRAEVIDETTVELTWDVIPARLSSVRGIKTQLSWRLWSGYNLDNLSHQGETENRNQHTQWETATVYITGEKVRKKNLLSNKKYEFRVRYVLASDLSGKKGSSTEALKGTWCHPIKVNLQEARGRPPPMSQAKMNGQQPTGAQRRGSFAEEVSEEEKVEDDTPAEEVHSDDEDQHVSSNQTSFPAWYQLLPPPDTITRKSLAGEPIRYIVSLHKYDRIASEIVGYISNSREVLVKKISGNWVLAQAHWKNTNSRDTTNRNSGVVWGYCELTIYSEILGKNHQLFEPLRQSQPSYQQQKKKQHRKFPSNPLNRSNAQQANDVDVDESEGYDSFYYQPNEKRGVDIWVQKYDENSGHYYYYNSSTGQSEWEAPEWIEEKDPTTGARYFVRLNTYDGSPMNSTWTKPKKFSRLVRS